MTYRVVFSQQAAEELEAAADWWREHRSEEQAANWYLGFSEAILTLGKSHNDLLSPPRTFCSRIRFANFIMAFHRGRRTGPCSPSSLIAF